MPVRKLGCSHSFCEACLTAMRTTGKRHIKCPVCSEETVFTEGEIFGLIDLHLNSLVECADIYDELNQTDVDFKIDEEREDWPDFVSAQLLYIITLLSKGQEST